MLGRGKLVITCAALISLVSVAADRPTAADGGKHVEIDLGLGKFIFSNEKIPLLKSNLQPSGKTCRVVLYKGKTKDGLFSANRFPCYYELKNASDCKLTELPKSDCKVDQAVRSWTNPDGMPNDLVMHFSNEACAFSAAYCNSNPQMAVKDLDDVSAIMGKTFRINKMDDPEDKKKQSYSRPGERFQRNALAPKYFTSAEEELKKSKKPSP